MESISYFWYHIINATNFYRMMAELFSWFHRPTLSISRILWW